MERLYPVWGECRHQFFSAILPIRVPLKEGVLRNDWVTGTGHHVPHFVGVKVRKALDQNLLCRKRISHQDMRFSSGKVAHHRTSSVAVVAADYTDVTITIGGRRYWKYSPLLVNLFHFQSVRFGIQKDTLRIAIEQAGLWSWYSTHLPVVKVPSPKPIDCGKKGNYESNDF